MKRSLAILFLLAMGACGTEHTPVDAGQPATPVCVDQDGDGVPGSGDCAGVTPLDCDDLDYAVHPGAAEQCNGRDDNCDGQIDEGLTVFSWSRDGDGDGYGSTSLGSGCAAPTADAVKLNGDCNDADPDVHPGAAEVCNGHDEDCDGTNDNGLTFQDFYVDQDGDGAGDSLGTPVSSCMATVVGRVANRSDCDDGNAAVHPGAIESCNKVDDDCDGQVDNNVAFRSYYPDLDGDGYGDERAAPESSCAAVPGKVPQAGDCNDTSAAVHPGVAEVCNAVDDDCNGLVDDALPTATYYLDADSDGFGEAGSVGQVSCAPIAGRVTGASDCDDGNAAVHPGATEVCNGVDDNCAGGVDDNLTFLDYFPDVDGDGYGRSTATPTHSCAPIAGWVANGTDCDDTRAGVHPGVAEVCNGLDDNCDGQVDNGLATQSYYPDLDHDGYGAGTATVACSAPAGQVANNTDCNDGAASIHPGAPELCNSIDDNCNGQIDDGVTTQSWYVDADSDGYGAVDAVATLSCSVVAGSVTNHTDCNDANSAIHPGVTEVCNGVDDNCNGSTDEGLTLVSYYPDVDVDGYGASSGAAVSSCKPVAGYVANNLDCNDGSFAIKPGAVELCNNTDDNCNGSTDEGNPGGGASCTTGQLGVCGPGTMTCQGGVVSCLHNVAPSTESCDGLDNNCDGSVDETWPTKGAACSAGVGVCVRSGIMVCNAAHTALTCNAVAGSPTAPSCDGLDNDCDGTVDEPFLASTVNVSATTAQDVEVAPYFYSAGQCASGASGAVAGTDTLQGGALAMGVGSSGISFQKLTSAGVPSGSPTSVTGLTYSDIALAQAADGFIVAGVWLSNNQEIDIYYVDYATGTTRTYLYTQFKTGNTLDSLRVVRVNGKRALLVWREAGVGIKGARVEVCNSAGTWSIMAPGCATTTLSPMTLVANTAVQPGVGAAAAFTDWAASTTCTPDYLRNVSIAYMPTASSVSQFTVYEDGSTKSAENAVYSVTAPRTLSEPEVAYFHDAASAGQWVVAYVNKDPGATLPDADLDYWLSNDTSWHYAYVAYATQNGTASIARPRVSVTASNLWLSAVRFVADATSFKRQVMTRITDLAGVRTPAGVAVELSATSGGCGADPDCRPGDKYGFTSWAAFGRVYYGAQGSAPSGVYESVLSCQ